MGLFDLFEDKERKEAENYKKDGDRYFREGYYLESAEFYNTALEKAPKYHEAFFGLGCVHLRLGNYREAAEAFQKAVEIDSENHRYHYELGLVHLEENALAAAVESFFKALELEPTSHSSLFGIGTAYKKMGNLDRAAGYFRKALELKPGDMDYQKALEEVNSLEANAGTDSAPLPAEPGKKPEDEKPVLPAWVKELKELLREGRAFEEKKDYRRALKYYIKAQSVDPQCVEAFCYQGRIHVKLGELPQGFKLLEKAYTAAPDNPEVLHSLGLAYVKSKDLKKAADLFKWAVENDPGFAQGFYDLGDVYLFLKENHKARDCFQKALQLDPTNGSYKKRFEETDALVRALEGTKEETESIKIRLQMAEEAAKAKYAEVSDEQRDPSLTDLKLELTQLAGLENIKTKVKDLVKFLKVQKIRKEKGLAVDNIPLHSIFLGPPGTGKTTVARLLGRILRAVGMLGKGHVIEAGAADMVSSSVPQTVEKTEKVIASARHGILLIADAYTLGNSAAVDIISRYMDEYKDTLIVIVAGESEKMQPFLKANPLLSSRFGNLFRFEYYQPQELTALFRTFSTEGGFRVDTEAVGLLLEYFKSVQPSKREVVGNSHYVRSFFQLVTHVQAERISEMDMKKVTDTSLTTITGRDVMEAIKQDTMF